MYHYSMEVSDYYSATKDHFAVEDLFNFNDEEANNNNNEDNTTAFEGIHVNSSSSSIIATDASSGSSVSAHQQHFSTDFSEPVEEVAELEWLSNFMEDCFSNKDSHHHHHYHQHHYQSQDPAHYSSTSSAVPAKARSKRSRANPGSWAARIPILPTQEDIQEQVQNVIATCQEGSGRRCLHCGSDKTPQWRMGPMGPKTLCNACGVRYKSGRLVPEYRPAASPTFVVSEHSNSHRKVVELRRQKEMQKQQKQHQNMLFWSQ